MFSVLGSGAVQGARVLDLYAGTGILGMEALSRGAAHADFVEASARLGQQIRESLRELSLIGRGRVYQARVEKALDVLPGKYDLVFADPPYDLDDWPSVMRRLGDGSMVKEDGIVIAEHRHGASLAVRYGVLDRVAARRYGDTSVSIYRAGASDG